MTNFASLCILSYNRPDYLEKTLRSLKENTTEPYQLIIHDDGSSADMMYDVLSGELADDAIIIQNVFGWNEGQGVALNRMFNIAKGDPIIKLDSDLEYSNGWLGKTTEILDSAPFIGLLGLCHYHHDPVNMAKTKIKEFKQFSYHTHILGSAFAVPRDCWEAFGPFSEYSDAFAEDWEFQKRVTDSEGLNCALPNEQLVKNVGMGIGKSTVVTADGSIAKIHKSPYIINNQNE